MGRQGSTWRVPGYTEIRDLGGDGGGRVVLARHDTTDLHVAITYLDPRLFADADAAERFRDEVRLIVSLDDPHTVRLYEYVEDERGAAIVMEPADGVTLRHLIEREGHTGPEAALVLLKCALRGLAAAHRLCLAHRDVRPENVIVTGDGDGRLTGFGVTVLTGRIGETVGAPPYMAPEQWRHAPAGPATDLYAATVTFFECLAGERPFPGETVAALAYQHRHTPPPVERVPEGLRGLVEHGMAKRPEDRPASAEAFLAELEEAAAAAYGTDWAERGRAGLRALTAPHAGLFPLAAPPSPDAPGTAPAPIRLTPRARLAVSGALTVTAAAAIIGAFTVLNTPPDAAPRAAPGPSRPVTAPPDTAPPATPVLSAKPRRTRAARPRPTPEETGEPPVTASPEPVPSQVRGAVGGPRPQPRPTAARPTRPATRPTSRAARPTAQPARPTSRPARPAPRPARPVPRPASSPAVPPTSGSAGQPTAEPDWRPPIGPPPNGPEPDRPPAPPALEPRPAPEQPGDDPPLALPPAVRPA